MGNEGGSRSSAGELSHHLAPPCSAPSDDTIVLAIDLPDLLPKKLMKSKVILLFFPDSMQKVRGNVAFCVGFFWGKMIASLFT